MPAVRTYQHWGRISGLYPLPAKRTVLPLHTVWAVFVIVWAILRNAFVVNPRLPRVSAKCASLPPLPMMISGLNSCASGGKISFRACRYV